MRKTTGQRLAAGFGLVLVVAACAALWRAKSGASTDAPVNGGAPAETDEHPAPAPSGAVGAAPPSRSARLPSTAQLAELDEARLMARLRTVAGTDPALAVQLARDGNRRFPDSPGAPERTSILIHALAGLDHGMEARGEAEAMVNHYPDSEWVREVERFTGAHRHRNVRINDAGVLEYH